MKHIFLVTLLASGLGAQSAFAGTGATNLAPQQPGESSGGFVNNNTSKATSESRGHLQQSGNFVNSNTSINHDTFSIVGKGISHCPNPSITGYANSSNYNLSDFSSNIGVAGTFPLGRSTCKEYAKTMLFRGRMEICLQLSEHYMKSNDGGYDIDFYGLVQDVAVELKRPLKCRKPTRRIVTRPQPQSRPIFPPEPAPAPTYTPEPQAPPVRALCYAPGGIDSDCKGAEKFDSREHLERSGPQLYQDRDGNVFRFPD